MKERHNHVEWIQQQQINISVRWKIKPEVSHKENNY
jgi:hypothetical protein